MNTYIFSFSLVRSMSIVAMGFFFYLFPLIAQATGEAVVISEIMYDLPGADTSGSASREWIEVKNIGTSAVDMTGWKLFDGSNHVLNVPSAENGGQGTLVLEPGAFAIIAAHAPQFSVDNPGYTGTLIDSVLSLNNEADTIKICSATCSASTLVDEVSYTSTLGASGDGNSLQLFQGGWISALPTPGTEATGSTNSNGSNGTTTNSSGGGLLIPSSKPVFLDSKKEPTWSTELVLSMPSIFAYVPFSITPTVLDPKLNTYATGRFVYTLGDGRVIEKSSSEPVTIEYEDPGTYVLYFEYYQYATDKTPTVSDRLLLAVEAVPIVLDLDFENDNKVTFSNLHSKDIDISGWKLTDGSTSVVFPKNTFAPAKQESTINKKIFHTYGKTLTLFTPSGHVATLFPSPIKKISTQDIRISPASIRENTTDVFSHTASLSESMMLSPTQSNSVMQSSVLPGFLGSLFSQKIDSWIILFVFFTLLIGVLFFVLLKQKSDRDSVDETKSPVSQEVEKFTIEEI